jgi:hypothetical protein
MEQLNRGFSGLKKSMHLLQQPMRFARSQNKGLTALTLLETEKNNKKKKKKKKRRKRRSQSFYFIATRKGNNVIGSKVRVDSQLVIPVPI